MQMLPRQERVLPKLCAESSQPLSEVAVAITAFSWVLAETSIGCKNLQCSFVMFNPIFSCCERENSLAVCGKEELARSRCTLNGVIAPSALNKAKGVANSLLWGGGPD